MVKAIYFIKRKPGMELGEFRRYWLKDHADKVRRVPELRKYVQCHTLDSGYARHEPIYDGVAELWYDDTATMRRIAGTAESRAAADDDARFIDMSRFDFVLVQERIQKEAQVEDTMPRLIAFLNRKPGLTPEEFQAYWADHHGPLAARVAQLRRYVQSHVRLSAYRAGKNPRYDGIAESWFKDLDAMRASAETPEYRAVRADEPNFLTVEGGRLPFIITRQYQIV